MPEENIHILKKGKMITLRYSKRRKYIGLYIYISKYIYVCIIGQHMYLIGLCLEFLKETPCLLDKRLDASRDVGMNVNVLPLIKQI